MSASRPHIVIFNPDQWRGDVMGHLGNLAAVTPNLDRLVEREAVSFRHCYCQNPISTPSRCSFMTGWYPHVRGHRTLFRMLHPEWDEPNLLSELRAAGYFVFWAGKNDLVPGQDGYAAYADVKHEPSDADFERWGHERRPGLHEWQGWRAPAGHEDHYSFMAGRLDKGQDTIYADNDWGHVLGACEFIRQYDGDQPLCVYLPLLYPHPPYGVEEPWFSMIDRSKLPPRRPAPDDWSGLPSIMRGLHENYGLGGWPEEKWDELRATYYGMCARVDHQLGLVIDALQDAGVYDETALFFFSDHGDLTGDYGTVEKTPNTFQDCLTRVPLVVKPPRSQAVAPGVRDALVELVDFTATAYETGGIEPGYDHFGRSLTPLIAGERHAHRDAVFCEGGRRLSEPQASEGGTHARPGHLYWPKLELQYQLDQPYHGKGVMCRTARHKYVYRLYEQDELYDLEADPHELVNRIDDPSLAEIKLALRERTLCWMVETADVVPRAEDRRG
jgi:arylsulfatase A-like enzyme